MSFLKFFFFLLKIIFFSGNAQKDRNNWNSQIEFIKLNKIKRLKNNPIRK